jgi:hypothetical protein
MDENGRRSNGSGRRGRLWLCVVVVLWPVLLACEPALEPPPAELVGTWRTAAPRYRDRVFEIREDAVVFGTGRFSGSRLHLLLGVERDEPVDGWDVYRLHYREYDGAITPLEIHLWPGGSGTLRFANRAERWSRAEGKGPEDA